MARITGRKYHNKKVIIDDLKFDSKKEARRYQQLKILERARLITDLRLQPEYELQEKFKINGKTIRAIKYRADFEYREKGQLVVEDVKGMKTDVYKLKAKIFAYKFGFEIKEI